jgi:hypothetical protein
LTYQDALAKQSAAKERRRKRAEKGPNRATRMRRVKAQLAVLWSIAVRRRDGKCVMCGKTDTLQAHHWLFFKSHSMALAFNPANGATLCYPCHIFKLHMRGDGDFAMRLCETMTARVGSGIVEEMREIARNPRPISLEELEELRYAFTGNQALPPMTGNPGEPPQEAKP